MQVIRLILLLSAGRQWGRYDASAVGYNDYKYPIAFSNNVFSIVPIDWSASDITIGSNYIFTVIEGQTTNTQCRIATNSGAAGLIYIVFIGR